jgi:hypothetical protein
MWIAGPITTVHNEHICHELTAVARISLATSRWLSDKNRSAAVVLGNHPISVRRILKRERESPVDKRGVEGEGRTAGLLRIR